MADTLTTNLLLTNQENGGNENTWGDIADTNFERLDNVLGDVTTVDTTGSDNILTDAQALVLVITVTGTLASNATITLPDRGGVWLIDNQTTGAFTVEVRVTSGVTVDQGNRRIVHHNGTDIVQSNPDTAAVAEESITGAATTDLLGTTSEFVRITGAGATITSFGTGANKQRWVRFNGSAIITHNATTLALPTGANISAVDGDTFFVTSDASGNNARVFGYQKADGTPLALGTGTVDNTILSNMANSTIKLRNTASTGDPEDVKISALTTESAPTSGDWLMGEESGGALRKFDYGLILDPPLPYAHLSGLQLSNGVSAPDINIAVGAARDSADGVNLNFDTIWSKAIDGGTWTAGNTGRLLASGVSLSTNTWYHIFIVDIDGGGTDIIGDTSLTCVNGLATSTVGTQYRRIGSIFTNGSSEPTPFFQRGDEFLWQTPVSTTTIASVTTSRSLITLQVPPDIQVQARFTGFVNAISPIGMRLMSPDEPDVAIVTTTPGPFPNLGVINTEGAHAGTHQGSEYEIYTDTSSRIAARTVSGTLDLDLTEEGWVDRRGKDGLDA